MHSRVKNGRRSDPRDYGGDEMYGMIVYVSDKDLEVLAFLNGWHL
jgi:hypothetical protein